MSNLEKQIRAIIFDDEFEILGKVKFKNDIAIGPQIEQFKVNSLIALFKNKFEEAWITIPKVDPNISDESITRFQANVMIKQAVEKVIDQLRKELQA